MPFLSRTVNLLGFDALIQPYETRVRTWDRPSRELPLAKLEAMTRPTGLADVPTLAAAILKGQMQGRLVVVPDG
jgi:acrylyl-CoA reductase (NADPH)